MNFIRVEDRYRRLINLDTVLAVRLHGSKIILWSPGDRNSLNLDYESDDLARDDYERMIGFIRHSQIHLKDSNL